MHLSRTLNVIVMALILLAVAAPAVQAGTLERSQRVLSPVDGSWLAAPMSWLAQILGFDRQAPQVAQKVGVTIILPPLPPVRPMTGACINPLGTGNTGGGNGGGGIGFGGGGGRPCNL